MMTESRMNEELLGEVTARIVHELSEHIFDEIQKMELADDNKTFLLKNCCVNFVGNIVAKISKPDSISLHANAYRFVSSFTDWTHKFLIDINNKLEELKENDSCH
jgi:hypothetical protein